MRRLMRCTTERIRKAGRSNEFFGGSFGPERPSRCKGTTQARRPASKPEISTGHHTRFDRLSGPLRISSRQQLIQPQRGDDMARKKSAEQLATIHAEAMAEFGDIQAAERDERLQCLQDRRFYLVTGAQWEGPLGEQF